ncbi:2'-5' RNA ligase family protein [Rhodococcus sp. NPDC049939]|uniref:2'-5' RNA ligase family protein n=1 Tax=Rhodococcus sp. NPDC049939 TaxID=3155511 RepID=UPI0033D308DB
MVQSVELLFDEETDVAVRAEWQRLWDAGLPSRTRVRAISNRPHVTLFVARHIPTEIDELLRRQIATPSFHIRLGGLVVFGSSRYVTLSRLVVPSKALLSLHRKVFDLAEQATKVPPHIRPGEWTPHVTLARRLPADQIPDAARLLDGGDIVGHASVMRRWDGDAKREWILTAPP